MTHRNKQQTETSKSISNQKTNRSSQTTTTGTSLNPPPIFGQKTTIGASLNLPLSSPPIQAKRAGDVIQRESVKKGNGAKNSTTINQTWLQQITKTHSKDRTKWPIENQMDYETRGFDDSRGQNAIPLILTQSGPITKEESLAAVTEQINKTYPNPKGGINHQGKLLTAYAEGGYKSFAALDPQLRKEQGNQVYREGGFDQMAEYIQANTTVRRKGNNYTHTKDSLRLTKDKKLMANLHRMGYWKDLDRRVVNAAEEEYKDWTSSDGKKLQYSEGHQKSGKPTRADELSKYWGVTHTDKRAQQLGKDSARDKSHAPWSAVFISHVMDKAGAGDTFSYADAHTNFARDANQNERKKRSSITHPSRLYDSDTEPAHVGGLMHRNRTGTNVTINNISGQSHSDIIVGIDVYNKDGTPATKKDDAGNSVPIKFEDLTAKQISQKNYQPFAVTIGGNTLDQSIEATKNGPQIVNRDRDKGINHPKGDAETVGRRYWPLNANGTFNKKGIGADVQPYGVQRMNHPLDTEVNKALE